MLYIKIESGHFYDQILIIYHIINKKKVKDSIRIICMLKYNKTAVHLNLLSRYKVHPAY